MRGRRGRELRDAGLTDQFLTSALPRRNRRPSRRRVDGKLPQLAQPVEVDLPDHRIAALLGDSLELAHLRQEMVQVRDGFHDGTFPAGPRKPQQRRTSRAAPTYVRRRRRAPVRRVADSSLCRERRLAHSITSSASAGSLSGTSRRLQITALSSGTLGRYDLRQDKLDLCPVARLAIEAEPATQTIVHDVVDNVQPEAGAPKIPTCRKERVERLTPDAGIHAAAVIAEEHLNLAFSECPYLDVDSTGLIIGKPVHDRIEEKIGEDLPI